MSWSSYPTSSHPKAKKPRQQAAHSIILSCLNDSWSSVTLILLRMYGVIGRRESFTLGLDCFRPFQTSIAQVAWPSGPRPSLAFGPHLDVRCSFAQVLLPSLGDTLIFRCLAHGLALHVQLPTCQTAHSFSCGPCP